MRRYIIIYITVLCMVIGSLSGCLSKPSNRDIRDRLAIELENKYGEKFDIAEADLADTGNLGVPGKIIAYTGKACTAGGKQFDVYYNLSENELSDTYANVLYSNSDIENIVKEAWKTVICNNEQIEINHIISSVDWRNKGINEYLLGNDCNIQIKMSLNAISDSDLIKQIKQIKNRLDEKLGNYALELDCYGNRMIVTSSTTEEDLLKRCQDMINTIHGKHNNLHREG